MKKFGPLPPSAKGSFVRYISTRGEAPPLGFVDVMLAGLARDGGLYVPESWPRLSEQKIAGFAGLPYAEVAVEVIQPSEFASAKAVFPIPAA